MAHGPPDVFLSPGGFWFGSGDLRVGTLLGSCVAITFWHPRLDLGGMCHYLLPHRARHVPPAPSEDLDGRYADEAMALFVRSIQRHHTHPAEYEVKLFGGGQQFPGADVPERNVEAGLRLIAGLGLEVTAHHLGGHGPRQVVLDLATGDVWVRHVSPLAGTGRIG